MAQMEYNVHEWILICVYHLKIKILYVFMILEMNILHSQRGPVFFRSVHHVSTVAQNGQTKVSFVATVGSPSHLRGE